MNPGQINDAHLLMNALAAQALGNTALTATDTSSFVSVGEAVLRTGYENTLNALGVVLSRTIFSVRPYKSKFWSLEVSGDRYGAITRKIIPLYSEAEAPQDVNIDTPEAVQNLADGQSIDMYTIRKPKMLQLNFYGSQALQKKITRFVHQLDAAFKSEAEFLQFVGAYMTEFYNEVELLNEARARAAVINRIAGQVAMNLAVVDVVASYNNLNGTDYTRDELLSAANIGNLARHTATVIKTYASRLTDMQTGKYHANLTGYQPIPRHTPRARQKLLMYDPYFITVETEVYSGLFNPKYLDIGRFESVNYWQSQDKPTEINITPAILNTTTGEQAKATQAVNIPYVLGLLFDEEALGWYPRFEMTASTPLNAAGLYWNTFMHWLFNVYNDYTENAVVFVLGDGGPEEPPEPAAKTAKK